MNRLATRFFGGAGWLFVAFPLGLIAAESSPYAVVPGWPELRPGFKLGEAAGVDVDSHNHVFVFHRGDPPIVRLDAKTGAVTASWGEGLFVRAHGLEVDHEDNVWVTDAGRHQVFKFSHDGKLLLTVGEKDKAGLDATHFDQPTDVVVAPTGEFYVTDGYGNSRVAKFSADGKFLFDWGKRGDGPGEFNLPHGIAIDAQGRLYVADRSNRRIQVFDAQGQFLHQWPTEGKGRPWGLEIADDGYLYVINGGDTLPRPPDFSEVLKMGLKGGIVERWGSFGDQPGQFSWGHDVSVGRDGAVYTVEVRHNLRVQKFVRKSSP